jgi:predicted RNase H-like nuclease (RuvC/YqgF family)
MATSSPSQLKIRRFRETISLQSRDIENLTRRLEAKDTRIKILDQTVDKLAEQLRFLDQETQNTIQEHEAARKIEQAEYIQFMKEAKKEVLDMTLRVERLTQEVRELSSSSIETSSSVPLIETVEMVEKKEVAPVSASPVAVDDSYVDLSSGPTGTSGVLSLDGPTGVSNATGVLSHDGPIGALSPTGREENPQPGFLSNVFKGWWS